MAHAGELHQVAVAHRILGQHHQVVAALFLRWIGVIKGAIDDIHLIADDRLHRGALAELEQLDGAVHHTVVGEREGRHPELFSPLHHRRQLTGSIQEAVVAVVMKRNEGQRRQRGVVLVPG